MEEVGRIKESVRILIIDDSKLILAQASDLVKSLEENIEVFTISSVFDAFDFLKVNKVDIIILDIIMPGMDGIEFLNKIQENQAYSDITVLMFSSIKDKKTLEKCFELGAKDYILKPLDPTEFIARLKSMVREKHLEKRILQQMEILTNKNKDLEQLNHKLGETQSQLVHQEKLAGIGQLAAGVAHEINNPLGFVSSNLEVLNKYYLKMFSIIEKSNDYVKKIINHETEDVQRESQEIYDVIKQSDIFFFMEDTEELFEDTLEGMNRIKKIVNGLRNFSRIDTVGDYDEYDLNEGIENTMIILRNELKYVAETEMHLEKVPYIQAKGGEINQVLLNLLVNARDAINERYADSQQGEIKIKTALQDEYVVLTIEDNGTGMPDTIVSDIFNPFFTTKPVGVGTGLGLSIVYDIIVKHHRGQINVDSKINAGTRFEIKLPKCQSKAEEPA